MTPDDFKAWRERQGLSQIEAAKALGLSRGSVQMYEMGRRKDDPGREVVIPKPVRLACAAIALGVRDYPPPRSIAA